MTVRYTAEWSVGDDPEVYRMQSYQSRADALRRARQVASSESPWGFAYLHTEVCTDGTSGPWLRVEREEIWP